MTLSIFILIFLLALSFLVSGTETAYFSLKEKDVITFKKERSFFVKLLRYPERFLVVILVLNNIANSFASAIFASVTLYLFERGSKFLIEILDTLLFSIILLIFAEITPKNIALTYPKRFALSITPFFKILYMVFEKIFYPFIFLLGYFRNFLYQKKGKKDFLDDLNKILDMMKRADGFTPEEKVLIERVMGMRNIPAKEIMIPYDRIKKVPFYRSVYELLKEEIVYSHMPVVENGKIIGIVKIWDILKKENKNKKILEITFPFSFYDENINIADLFLKMVKRKEEFVILTKGSSYTGCLTLTDISNLFLKNIP